MIKGSGGGSKADASVSLAGMNVSLRSSSTVEIIEAICEGPIAGLVSIVDKRRQGTQNPSRYAGQSIFLDKTPLIHVGDDGTITRNFHGYKIWFRNGTANQKHIPFDYGIQSEEGVNLLIDKENSPHVQTINDLFFDDLIIKFSLPGFYCVTKQGEYYDANVSLKIEVVDNNGVVYQAANNISFSGQCASEYQRQYVLRGFRNGDYGPGPWDIRIYRETDDTDSVRIVDKVYWYSYTLASHDHLTWPYTVVAGTQINARQFGNKVPTRAYEIYGYDDVLIPSNYYPLRSKGYTSSSGGEIEEKYPSVYREQGTQLYEGEWDGTFKRGWTDNPVWCLLEILTNERFGLGFPQSRINKWLWYDIARYCDAVDSEGKFVGVPVIEDGITKYEPRYSLNCSIETQEDAYSLINTIASSFAAMPFWGNGKLYLVQDKLDMDWAAPREINTAYNLGDIVTASVIDPETRTIKQNLIDYPYEYECISAGITGKSNISWPTTVGSTVTDGTVTWKCRYKRVNATHIATKANVENGDFNYSGSSIKARHTVARVTWNNPEDLCRPAIEVVENNRGIAQYGWNPIDVYLYGCTRRSQAIRYGRFILESELNQKDTVSFVGGFYFADCFPGSIVEVQDPHYTVWESTPGSYTAPARFAGNIVSVTNDESYTYITLDQTVTIQSNHSYWLSVSLPRTVDSDDTNPERKLQVTELNVLNSAGTTSTIKVDKLTTEPDINSPWVLLISDLYPVYYRVINNREKEPGKYEITAIYYDRNKYARIDKAVLIPTAPTSNIPSGTIAAPTNITATEYGYKEGKNWKFALKVSWDHVSDPRVLNYVIEYCKTDTNSWKKAGTTEDNNFDIKPIKVGTYDIRIRAEGTSSGAWGYLYNVSVTGNTANPPDITNFQVKGGGYEFPGRNCVLVWDSVIDEDDESDLMPLARFKSYRLRFYDLSNNLKATVDCAEPDNNSYVFDFDENIKVFGTPTSSFKVGIVAVDLYDVESANENIQTFSTTTIPVPQNIGLKNSVWDSRDCEIEWDSVVSSTFTKARFAYYEVQIYDSSGNYQRSYHVTRSGSSTTKPNFIFTWQMNHKVFGDRVPTFKIKIKVFDDFGDGGTASDFFTCTASTPPTPSWAKIIDPGRIDDDTYIGPNIHIGWEDVVDSGDIKEELFDKYKITVRTAAPSYTLLGDGPHYTRNNNFCYTKGHNKSESPPLGISDITFDISVIDKLGQESGYIRLEVGKDDVPKVQNLKLPGTQTRFRGKNCKIEWDTVISASFPSHRLLGYKIFVYNSSDVYMNYEIPIFQLADSSSAKHSYIFTYEENEKVFGTATNSFILRVAAIDCNGDQGPASDPLACIATDVPTVTGLQLGRGLSGTFPGINCPIQWNSVISTNFPKSRLVAYTIHVYDSSGNEKTLKSGASNPYKVSCNKGEDLDWVFTYEKNVDLFGTPTSGFKIAVGAVDCFGNESTTLTQVQFTSRTPPDVSGLTYVFNNKNCQIYWNSVVGAVADGKVPEKCFLEYRLRIKQYGTSTVKRVVRHLKDLKGNNSTEDKYGYYNYKYEQNEDDFTTPVRQFTVEVKAYNIFGIASTNWVSVSPLNAAPDMSAITPSVTPTFSGVDIDWSDYGNSEPSDIKKYKVEISLYVGMSPVLKTKYVSRGTLACHFKYSKSTSQAIYARVTPYDVFGAGTASGVGSTTYDPRDIDNAMSEYLTGTTNKFRTATSGARIEIGQYSGSEHRIIGYDSSGNAQFYLSSSTGKAYCGGGAVVQDSTGISIVASDTDDPSTDVNVLKFTSSDLATKFVKIYLSDDSTNDRRTLFLLTQGQIGANRTETRTRIITRASNASSSYAKTQLVAASYNSFSNNITLELYCDQTGTTKYVSISGDTNITGKLGIGTSSPNESLGIHNASGSATSIVLSNSADTADHYQQIVLRRSQSTESGPLHQVAIRQVVPVGGSSGGKLSFLTEDTSGTLTERLSIDQNGKSSFTGQIASTLASGTAPITVTSTTACTNLNADMVDGKHSTDLVLASEKGTASGVATLDSYSKVVQDPANATSTPTASKIVIADASGKVDSWVSNASTSGSGKVQLSNSYSGTSETRAVTEKALSDGLGTKLSLSGGTMTGDILTYYGYIDGASTGNPKRIWNVIQGTTTATTAVLIINTMIPFNPSSVMRANINMNAFYNRSTSTEVWMGSILSMQFETSGNPTMTYVRHIGNSNWNTNWASKFYAYKWTAADSYQNQTVFIIGSWDASYNATSAWGITRILIDIPIAQGNFDSSYAQSWSVSWESTFPNSSVSSGSQTTFTSI